MLPRLRLRLALVIALLAAESRGHSSGVDSCSEVPPGHGALGGSAGAQQTVSLLYAGAAVTSYTPGAAHTLQLSGTLAWKGFAVAGFAGAAFPGSFAAAKAGAVSAPFADARAMSSCAGGMTHPSATSVTSASGAWTAPAAGTGAVTFHAVFVQLKTGTHLTATLTVAEGALPSPSPSPPPPSASPTPSSSPTPSASPTGSLSASSTLTPSNSATPTPSLSLGVSSSGTPTISLTPSATPSSSRTPTPSQSPTPSPSPSTSPCSRGANCNGNGACPAALPAGCVCDAGYAGPVCTQCWPAFAIATRVGVNASASVCSAPESLDLTLLSASVSLRLLGLAGVAGAEGSAARAAFAAGLATDLAAALRVGASRFAVASLSAAGNGSLVANISVLAPALATDTAASDLAVSLQRMAGDASSMLFRGTYTRAVDLAFPPPAALSLAPPSPAVFTQSLALGPGLTLQWRIARGRFFGRLSSSRGGWASVGVNTQLGMLGADAILVEPAAPGPSAAKISLVTLPSYSGVTRVAAASALATLDAASSNFSLHASGGGWTADFSRLLAAGAYAGALPLPAAGSAMLVAAWGAPADGFVALHAKDAVVLGIVDFSTGAFAAAGGDAAALTTVHGVFMALAWAVLVPLAIATLRYGRGAAAVPEVRAVAFRLCGTALRAHIRLQSAALLLTLIGLGLAVAAVPAGRHFASAHGAVGLAVLLVALAQPALGAGLSLPAHRALGFGVTAVAVVSVLLGLRLVDATGTLVTLYALFLALSVGAAALLERRVMAKLLRDKLARAAKAGGAVDAFETAAGVSALAIAASASASAAAADAPGREGRSTRTALVAVERDRV